MFPKATQEEDLQRNLKTLTQRQMCNVFGSFFSRDDQTDANKTNYRREMGKTVLCSPGSHKTARRTSF